MIRPLRHIRMGQQVVRRNHLRRQLLQEVDQLLARAEVLETAENSVRNRLEDMIAERCKMLARLCG